MILSIFLDLHPVLNLQGCAPMHVEFKKGLDPTRVCLNVSERVATFGKTLVQELDITVQDFGFIVPAFRIQIRRRKRIQHRLVSIPECTHRNYPRFICLSAQMWTCKFKDREGRMPY